ncbi:hypothetical protein [Gorillibacterium sp. sgz5001074]|uniref:hypothetical protein n=1 Tax=Gorillibacterium sp. sgz5001074 TaxID=3446695 RepID=UPI003F678EAF
MRRPIQPAWILYTALAIGLTAATSGCGDKNRDADAAGTFAMAAAPAAVQITMTAPAPVNASPPAGTSASQPQAAESPATPAAAPAADTAQPTAAALQPAAADAPAGSSGGPSSAAPAVSPASASTAPAAASAAPAAQAPAGPRAEAPSAGAPAPSAAAGSSSGSGDIHWSEFFDNEQQNRPSEKFWDMNGKTVTIKGYMGEVLSFEKHWFLVIPQPGAECPFDNGDETYWNKIMIAFTDKGEKLRYTSGALKITGRLDVGVKVDESGYKTMFRLYDASFEKLKE